MANEDINGFIPWALAGIGAVVSALLTGVISLFRMREAENAKQLIEHKTKINQLEVKSDKCEEQRVELYTKCEVHGANISHLHQELAWMKTRIANIDKDGTKYSHRNDDKDG